MNTHIFKYFHFIVAHARHRRASPLVEEAILIGVALLVFILLGAIILELVHYASDFFESFSNTLSDFPQ